MSRQFDLGISPHCPTAFSHLQLGRQLRRLVQLLLESFFQSFNIAIHGSSLLKILPAVLTSTTTPPA
jgi:hypothetical protein